MFPSYLRIAGRVKLAVFGAGLLGCGALAYAASPADTIAARQANFKQMSKGMKAIGDEIKSPTPDNAAIKAGAIAIEQAAAQVSGYFAPGTGPESGLKTSALPAIWQKPDEFNGDAARLVAAAAVLRMAADTGNVDQVKTQLMVVGGTCKACHEAFREPQS